MGKCLDEATWTDYVLDHLLYASMKMTVQVAGCSGADGRLFVFFVAMIVTFMIFFVVAMVVVMVVAFVIFFIVVAMVMIFVIFIVMAFVVVAFVIVAFMVRMLFFVFGSLC